LSFLLTEQKEKYFCQLRLFIQNSGVGSCSPHTNNPQPSTKLNNARALRLLFTANAVSGFAQGITMLAIPWYFAQHNESTKFNAIYAGVTFIALFWGLYAGALVDRFPRKRAFLITNLLEGVLLVAIAGYGFATDSMPTAGVVMAFTVTIFGYNIHYPNLYAFVQEITEPGAYSKVTSNIEIVGQSTSILSGALAALLLEGVPADHVTELFGLSLQLPFAIPKWEIWEIFLLDGITYILAVALIAAMKYQPFAAPEVETGSLVKRLKTGFDYLRAHPIVFLFGTLSYAVFVALLVELFACAPMYVNRHLNAGGAVFGAAEVFYAIGALGAGLFLRRIFSHIPVPKLVIFLMLGAAAVLFLAAVTRSVAMFMLISVIIGLTNAGTRIFRVSWLFHHVPNEVIGRVNSIFNMLNILMRTLFILLFSLRFFETGNNVIYAYAVLGAFVLLAAILLMLRYRTLVKTPVTDPIPEPV
jgi:DHA3 family macrolide efflux protein-like MFS transporter